MSELKHTDPVRSSIGTMIYFHQRPGLGAGEKGKYKALKLANGKWFIAESEQPLPLDDEMLDRSHTTSEFLKDSFIRGAWIVDNVVKTPVSKEQLAQMIVADSFPTPKTTPKKKANSFAARAKALNKLGVNITLRKDGWSIFESDWCRLEVSPEVEEFDDVLTRAEKAFGNS